MPNNSEQEPESKDDCNVTGKELVDSATGQVQKVDASSLIRDPLIAEQIKALRERAEAPAKKKVRISR